MATKTASAKSATKGRTTAKKKSGGNSKKIRTPMFRLSYCHIWKPQVNDEDDTKEVYQVAAIFDGDADMKPLLGIIKEAKQKKWGDQVPADCRSPLVRYTKEWFIKNEGEAKGPKLYKQKVKDNPEYDGKIAAQLKSYNRQPGVMDNRKNLLDPEDKRDRAKLVSGYYACATVTAWAYDHPKGGPGVSLSLQNIMILKKGEPLSGGAASAEEDFEEVDVSEYGIDNDEMFDEEEDEEGDDESEDEEESDLDLE